MIPEDGRGFSIKPYISLSKVRDIIQQFYGLKAIDLEELNSYDDRNFRFSVYEDGEQSTKSYRKRLYLLKISAYLPEKCESVLSLHNGIMIHLWTQGISCQQPLASVNNKLVESIELPQFQSMDLTVGEPHRTHTMRLFTFVQGQMWSSLTPLETESYWHMGAFLARLHRHLKQHLNSWTKPILEPAWSLINAPNALDYVDFVVDEDHRKLARNVLQTFRDNYANKLRITNWVPGMEDKDFPI
ncbi:hydroxylysine kinase, partial [Paragonimus westermani]